MVSKTKALKKSHTLSDRACCIKAVLTCAIAVFIALSRFAVAADLTIDINSTQVTRTIPDTLYGTNLTAWDGVQNGSNSSFNNLMIASGQKYMRWPGGSWGDAYLWSDMEGPSGSNSWIVSYDETLYLLGRLDATLQPIVNFPGYWFGQDHSDAEAIAAAVAWVEDQTSRTPCAQYWEIGNEIGGSWEAGWFDGISGGYYGDQFSQFYTAMKAVNPDIKIGACAEPYDSRESWYTYDGLWTREMLTAMDVNWGVVPDFLIVHAYPGSGYGSSYNPALLGSKVDEIEDFTESMDAIITDVLGPEYVGQIKYWLTEWNSGGIDGTYERWRLFVNAMFQLQYTLEMAEHGWEGSNTWGNSYYWNSSEFPNFYPYPNWYIYPFLTKKFGADLVPASSSNSIVRAYASRCDNNELTIFIINNSPSTNLTAEINITRLASGAQGSRWLLEGAGTTPTGAATPLQDLQDIKINGAVHPNPLTIDSLEGVSFTSYNTFEINLPKSSITFLSVPLTAPQAPFGGVAWAVPGTIEAEDYDVGGEGASYHDTGFGNDGNEYRTDDVDIETCDEGGYNITGVENGEWLEYTVDVNSTGVYQFQARVGSAESDGVFHVECDGVNLTGEVSFDPTGDDQTFATVEVNGLPLQAGQRVIRLAFDSDDMTVNWFGFTKIGGGTGQILRQYWLNVAGDSVSELCSSKPYPAKPTGRDLITSMEAPNDWADSYGTRIRGFLNPIADGNYTFWIAADQNAELWLSPDIDPNNSVLIAYTTNSTDPCEWDKYPEQQSSTVSLAAGQKYYIEVLHKENTGSDHVSVSWQGPDFSQQVIDGLYLSPYINIKKCAVKAGKVIGYDNITCTGDFEATLAQLNEADRITVKIYSVADDYLVFEQSIDFDAFTLKKNTYSYKYKPASGQPGAITSLKFDIGKKTFSLQAKNIDLAGLACPLYMTIDAGSYCGTAVVDELVVNKKKSIPIRLMSGYADTLAVTKLKVTNSTTPAADKLSVKGTITVADDSNVADGLTITWGTDSWTVPGEQFVQVKTGRYKCAYADANGVITADFNFTKCTFTISIKQTTLSQTSGSFDFTISFGDYSETAEIQL
jgi:hypothetical protein